jgi:hypothetical protein
MLQKHGQENFKTHPTTTLSHAVGFRIIGREWGLCLFICFGSPNPYAWWWLSLKAHYLQANFILHNKVSFLMSIEERTERCD